MKALAATGNRGQPAMTAARLRGTRTPRPNAVGYAWALAQNAGFGMIRQASDRFPS